MFHYTLYIIWLCIPGFFFLMALWGQLEKVGGKKRREQPGDFFKQGLFVLICVGISMIIDSYFLAGLRNSIPFANEAPFEFYEIVLLPAVLAVGAKVIGPTKDIKITKPPNPTKRKR